MERYLGPSRQGKKISREEATRRASILKARDLRKIPVAGPLVRFPGGKTKLQDSIVKYLDGDRYVEPFAGGLGIGLNVITGKKESWINDADFNIYAMWSSVIHHPKKLIGLASDFTPSVDAFKEFKTRLSNHETQDLVQIGVMKLAMHQMTFSGLGERGGPLGEIGCRWNFQRIKKQILLCHAILRNTRCTCMDFEAVIKQAPQGWSIFCDPPYLENGNAIYAHRFTKEDHVRLAEVLRHRTGWVLSYDDNPEIRRLYDFATIDEVDVRYSINSAAKKRELVIHA